MPSRKSPVVVIGPGTMGGDIALSWALAGRNVVLTGRSEGALVSRLETVGRKLGWMVRQQLVPAADHHTIIRRISVDARSSVFANASFVVEAIPEELEVKRRVLGAAESVMDPEAILASTTSSLSPTQLAEALMRPERFIVTHYAQPAHLVSVVEVVRGRQTADSTVREVISLLTATGKMPVVVADVPGFLFARLQYALLRELLSMVQAGQVSPTDCDLVMKYGYGSRLPAMGPFEHLDLIGLPFALSLAQQIWPDLSCWQSPEGSPLQNLINQGRTGAIVGAGFYEWTPESHDKFVEARDRQVGVNYQYHGGGSSRGAPSGE